MNHLPARIATCTEPRQRRDVASSPSNLAVGDVLVRRDEPGYGIFNYRGESVLELPVPTSAEAARLAAEIVSPWGGRVRIDDSLLAD